MNSFEKLLMIVVPSSGLAMMFYFFTLYAPNVENGNFTESQRLQGQPYVRTVTRATSNLKNYKPKSQTKQRVTERKNHIKWQSDKAVTHMPQTLKNQKYKQTRQQTSYISPVENTNDQSALYAKQRVQKQIQNRKIKQNQKKMKVRECSYYEQRKEEIRDRMRRKYKASQYNRLEKTRKYWSKKYADNCFSGYQYPR